LQKRKCVFAVVCDAAVVGRGSHDEGKKLGSSGFVVDDKNARGNTVAKWIDGKDGVLVFREGHVVSVGHRK
jgi:hypothetical protein